MASISPLPIPSVLGNPAGLFDFTNSVGAHIQPTIAAWSNVFSVLLALLSNIEVKSLSDVAPSASVIFSTMGSELKGAYMASNPAVFGGIVNMAILPIFLFFQSSLTDSYLLIDRLWGITPMLSAAHFVTWAWLHGLPIERASIVTAVIFVWGLRLTFNFIRRGGFTAGGEDYRWKIVRTQYSGLGMVLLRATYTCFTQFSMLYMITLPVYYQVVVSQSRALQLPLYADIAFAVVALAFVEIEAIADKQQAVYQAAKNYYLENAKIPRQAGSFSLASVQLGFCTNGLWRYSRHPNYFAEQAIWTTIFAWGAALISYSNPEFLTAAKLILTYPFQFRVHFGLSSDLSAVPSSPILAVPEVVMLEGAPSIYHVWSAIKTVSPPLYTLIAISIYYAIFQGSSRLTEKISSSKYPIYAAYQDRVGRFFPKTCQSPLALKVRSKIAFFCGPLRRRLQADAAAAAESRLPTWYWNDDVSLHALQNIDIPTPEAKMARRAGPLPARVTSGSFEGGYSGAATSTGTGFSHAGEPSDQSGRVFARRPPSSARI